MEKVEREPTKRAQLYSPVEDTTLGEVGNHSTGVLPATVDFVHASINGSWKAFFALLLTLKTASFIQ